MLNTEKYEKILSVYKNDIIYNENQDVIQTPIEYLNEGVWSYEPNRFDFIHKKSTFQCQILRMTHAGHLCGYVYIPDSLVHLLEIDPNHKYSIDADVHGGVTQSEYVEVDRTSVIPSTIGSYVIGFDTAHYNDFSPLRENQASFKNIPDYKDFNYVLKETISLADQLWKLIEPKKDYIQLHEEDRLNVLYERNNCRTLKLQNVEPKDLNLTIFINWCDDGLNLYSEWKPLYQKISLNLYNQIIKVKYWKIIND